MFNWLLNLFKRTKTLQQDLVSTFISRLNSILDSTEVKDRVIQEITQVIRSKSPIAKLFGAEEIDKVSAQLYSVVVDVLKKEVSDVFTGNKA